MQEMIRNNFIDEIQKNGQIKLASDQKLISFNQSGDKSASFSIKSNERPKIIEKTTLKNKILSDYVNSSIFYLSPRMKNNTIKKNSIKPVNFNNTMKECFICPKKKTTNLIEKINLTDSLKIKIKEKNKPKPKKNPFFESTIKVLEAKIQNKIKSLGLQYFNNDEDKIIVNRRESRQDTCPLFSPSMIRRNAIIQHQPIKINIQNNSVISSK